MGFSKKASFLFKLDKRGKIAVECVSNGFFSTKNVFHANYEGYLAKKSGNFERRKN